MEPKAALLGYIWGGVAMLFAQATDPNVPAWINSVTQITGWGVLGWLVYHTHARTLPALISDFTKSLESERVSKASERALDRKEVASMMSTIVQSHTSAWEGVRDRIHRVSENLQVLSAKVEIVHEFHRSKEAEG